MAVEGESWGGAAAAAVAPLPWAAAAGAGPEEEEFEDPPAAGREIGTTATGGLDGDVGGLAVGGAVGVGLGVGFGVGLGDGLGLALGDGVGLGLGVGLAVGEGEAAAGGVDCARAAWGMATITNPIAVASRAARYVSRRDRNAVIWIQAGPSLDLESTQPRADVVTN